MIHILIRFLNSFLICLKLPLHFKFILTFLNIVYNIFSCLLSCILIFVINFLNNFCLSSSNLLIFLLVELTVFLGQKLFEPDHHIFYFFLSVVHPANNTVDVRTIATVLPNFINCYLLIVVRL